MTLDIVFFCFFFILMLRYMIVLNVWRAPLYRSHRDVSVLSQSGEMAWNLPQHPSRHPGSAERLGERRPFRGGSAGSSQNTTLPPAPPRIFIFLSDAGNLVRLFIESPMWHSLSFVSLVNIPLPKSFSYWLLCVLTHWRRTLWKMTDSSICNRSFAPIPFWQTNFPFHLHFIQVFFPFHLIFSCSICNGTHLVTNLAHVLFFFSQTAFLDHILPFSQCCQSLFSLSVEDHRQHQGKSVQHGHLCSGLAGGPRPHAGKGWEGEAPDDDPATSDAAVWRKHSTVL